MEELDYLITYNIFDETNTFQNFGFNKPWKQEPQRASSYVPTMEEISTCRASDSLPLLVGGGYEAAPLYPSNFSPAKQSAEPCKSTVRIHPIHIQVMYISNTSSTGAVCSARARDTRSSCVCVCVQLIPLCCSV